MKKNTRILAALLTAAVLGSALTASFAFAGETEGIEPAEVRTIVAATSASPRPFTYYEDDGELTGQNIKLLEAIFDRLPQYELKWEVTDFPSIFTGLDAGRYQVGVNNLGKNKERLEKYLYTDAMFSNSLAVIAAKDADWLPDEGAVTFADLAGHTYAGDPSITYTTDIEKWNDANPDQEIGIVYSEEGIEKQLQVIEDGGGSYDFITIDKPMYDGFYKPEFNLDLKEVPLNNETGLDLDSYFIVPKEETQLAEDINRVLHEVVADGTSKEISITFLGDDYSPVFDD